MNPETALWIIVGFWASMLAIRGFMGLLWWWGLRVAEKAAREGKLKISSTETDN